MPRAAAAALNIFVARFPPTFWVANTLLLPERLAYYGSKSVLAIFVAQHVGLGTVKGMFLVGSVFNTLIYVLPLGAGPLIDRIGFKRGLLVGFIILSIGYGLIFQGGAPAGQWLVESVGKTTWILLALIVAAIGGALVKPAIAAMVARATDETSRALGFSIYYTLANIGCALGPLAALFVQEHMGIAFVFLAFSILSLLPALIVAISDAEPEESVRPGARTLKQILAQMAPALFDPRFMLLLLILSGFWFTFWQLYYALPFYAEAYLDFSSYQALHSVEAWIIMLLTVPVAFLVRRLRLMSAMILGVAIAAMGWFVLALWPTITGLFVGVVVFAIGEAIHAPRFYDYVASITPAGQTATYMGLTSLPVAIGTFAAGATSGELVEYFVSNQNPAAPQMWYVVGACGLLTALLLLAYDAFVSARPAR